jgi:hypothetical protein
MFFSVNDPGLDGVDSPDTMGRIDGKIPDFEFPHVLFGGLCFIFSILLIHFNTGLFF